MSNVKVINRFDKPHKVFIPSKYGKYILIDETQLEQLKQERDLLMQCIIACNDIDDIKIIKSNIENAVIALTDHKQGEGEDE
jgi:hypothetical protein